MRTSLWFLLLVTFYLHDKCVISRDIPGGFKTTFQSVADFIKSFVSKSSSTAHDGKERNKGALNSFQHHAWEDGEAKYQNTTEKHNSSAAYQLTVTEVAQWHGYNIETHIVKTMDGYFLTTHRLIGVSNLRNRTVLLYHGLLGSAMDWILLGPGECMMPFTLAEAGYDVWFMNARGNIYSRNHATLTLSMPEFWDFSFEEMGLIDIPAVIDYIIKQNDVPIDFVAHSMGSTAFLVYLSSVSEYKKYLRTGVLIAPVAFMKNVTGPLHSVPESTFKPRKGEFMPHRKVSRKLASEHCKGPIKLCRNPLFFLTGVPAQTSFTARVKDHVPAGGSVKTILHYKQLVKSGKFHSYKNKEHQYDMHSIDVPLALISSNNDQLAIVKNVHRIYELIKYPIAHYIIRNKNVSHTDLLWDKTASCVVIRKTLEYLVKGHKNNNQSLEEKSRDDTKIQINNKKNNGKAKIESKNNDEIGINDNNNDDDTNENYNNDVTTDKDANANDNNNGNGDNDDNNKDSKENNDKDVTTDKDANANDNNNGNGDNDDNNKDSKENNDKDVTTDKDANANDNNNGNGDNDDNNKDSKENNDKDGEDNSNDEDVEDEEDEVTSTPKDKESNENKILVKDKDEVKSESKNRIKIKIVKENTEGTGESENKDNSLKFLIELKGADITVRKLEDNQDKNGVKGEVKSNYNEIHNETSGDHKYEYLKFDNQGTGTNNDKEEGKGEHKCVNPIGKDNETCVDDIIDDGHIFYDGPEAYMDFQVT